MLEEKKEIEKKEDYDVFSDDNYNIKHLLYVKRDFLSALKEINKKFEYLRSSDNKNKHKCDRKSDCECIEFCLLLIDIYENYPLEKSLIDFFHEYYFYIHSIPFVVIKAMVLSRMKFLDYSEVKKIIDQYLTYSNIPIEAMSEEKRDSNQYSMNRFTLKIKEDEYIELNEYLVAIVLQQKGFLEAKVRIMSLNLSTNVKETFLKKLQDLYFYYTEKSEITEEEQVKTNTETNEKLGEIFNRNDTISDNIDIEKYSEFTVKYSLLNKVCAYLLRKKVLYTLFMSIVGYLVYKLFKARIGSIAEYFLQFRLIKKVFLLIRGLFSLLVEH